MQQDVEWDLNETIKQWSQVAEYWNASIKKLGHQTYIYSLVVFLAMQLALVLFARDL